MSVYQAVKVALPLLAFVVLFASCSFPAAYAAEPSDGDVIDADIVQDAEPAESADTAEPADGGITDAQFKAYVLGCLFFFVIVILAYFAYKFFSMFF